jgi:hypothetical protein
MRLKAMILLAALALVAAACGSGEDIEPADAGVATTVGSAETDTETPPTDAPSPEEPAEAPSGPSGSGEITVDGETFQINDVRRCEPFDFNDENNPNDLDVVAGTAEGVYLSLVISNATGYADGGQKTYEQQTHELRINRSGNGGSDQFVAAASHDIDNVWYLPFSPSFGTPQEGVMLSGPPFVRDGDSISGGMVVTKDYPEEDGSTLDVTFNFDFPSDITGC